MSGLFLVTNNTQRTSSAPDLVLLHEVLQLRGPNTRQGNTLGQLATLPLGTVRDVLRFLCDLSEATAELARGRRQRAVVRLCMEPDLWELGLERSGHQLLVTIFQGGDTPEVAVHEHVIDGRAFCTDLIETIKKFGAKARSGSDQSRDCTAMDLACLDAAAQQLAPLAFVADPLPRDRCIVVVEPTTELPIEIAAELSLRPVEPSGEDLQPDVLRADPLSLLFRGKVRICVGELNRELPNVFVFVVAEHLVALSLEALDAWVRRQNYHRRNEIGGAIVGVRLHDEGALSLTLGLPRQHADARGRASEERVQTWMFPAVDVTTLAQAVVAFGRALSRSLVRRDRSQLCNLRLFEFRARVRDLSDRLREVTRNDTKINMDPESYRAFAVATRPADKPPGTFGDTRMCFSARWTTIVPGIELRSTFLCGDVLIVGATNEINCIDRRTGYVLWTKPVPRAVSVMTSLGLVRLLPDGTLDLHDLRSGDVTWSARLRPRVGTNAAGAVISAPGLPRMLIVSEGSRHLASVDLHSGHIRWRYAARRGDNFRLRRAGKLVIIANGEPSLLALDVLSGDVIWRFCDQLRFSSPVAIDNDSLFALAGDGALVGRGGTRLHHLDPWAGTVRWSIDLPATLGPVGAPLLSKETVCMVTHSRKGTGLVGFDRRTGAKRFERVVCGAVASSLVVDDIIVVNSESNEFFGVSAKDGSMRYRLAFSSSADGDRPRRLEPVLRSGALFVPQSEVHVVRPRDGALLGKLPTELIPDLLRVDERCDVYVAEESGHLASYAAMPRLSLVQ